MQVEKCSEKISEAIAVSQRIQLEAKESLFIQNECIEASVQKISGHFATHCRLMTDMKNLVKSMAKVDECSEKAQEFITEYRKYAEKFMPLLHRFRKECSGKLIFMYCHMQL